MNSKINNNDINLRKKTVRLLGSAVGRFKNRTRGPGTSHSQRIMAGSPVYILCTCLHWVVLSTQPSDSSNLVEYFFAGVVAPCGRRR